FLLTNSYSLLVINFRTSLWELQENFSWVFEEVCLILGGILPVSLYYFHPDKNKILCYTFFVKMVAH
ncbi:MAG: hypothetical protein N2Z79_02155, partial [Candidatus Omnitrophica bacterium]|nr:hypothetical protein [Candidatus Omnitrophota bacterium]